MSLNSGGDEESVRGVTMKRNDDTLLSPEAARAVARSKTLVYLVLVLAGLGVGLGAFRYTRSKSTDDFEFSFYSHAEELIHETDNKADSLFSEVHSISISFTSLALNTKSVWPNVTEPNFDVIAEAAQHHLDLEVLLMAPAIRSQPEKEAFESYATANQEWLTNHDRQESSSVLDRISPTILGFPNSEEPPPLVSVPVWQYGPHPQDSTLSLMDLNTHPVLRRSIDIALSNGTSTLSDTFDAEFILEHFLTAGEHVQNAHRILGGSENINDEADGMYSMYFQPIFSTFTDEKTVVGFIIAVISWRTFFSNLFQESNPIDVVVEQSCGLSFTYRVFGKTAVFLGIGDLHDPAHEFTARKAPLFQDFQDGDCTMTKTIYSTEEYKKDFETNQSVYYTLIVCVIFLFTVAVFIFYDIMVQRRLRQIHLSAQRSNAVVTSLFPKHTAEQLLDQFAANESDSPTGTRRAKFFQKSSADSKIAYSAKPTDDISSLLRTTVGASQYVLKNRIVGRPLADLFPSATVMFADMTGFTAWSSAREPNQVFVLLETIYGAFDKLAQMRRIFKVETIGDCYVAVCGLPEPRENHEIVMARFAHECIHAMTMLSQQLEVKLGPETADLGLRVGLHSGSVTAGVLRGDKARFQLFGDTVNVTARIEAAGMKNKIHISKETANGIIKAGKGHWLTERKDKILAKGKGELDTYWLDLGDQKSSIDGAVDKLYDGAAEDFDRISSVDDRRQRLIEWAVGLLENKLQKVVAVRNSLNSKPSHVKEQKYLGLTEKDFTDTIVRIPPFKKPLTNIESSEIDIGKVVRGQLKDFVSNIALLYRDNSFHNLEHAAHVTNSVVKLFHATFEGKGVSDSELYRQTFGISFDPMMRFTVVLSAIIHDMDHPGVPNVQLVKEGTGRGKSIAEVHSLNLAWELLMKDKYSDLRKVIYTTQDDYERFRSVLISSVLATDCLDKDLADARRSRWDSAFAEGFFDDGEQNWNNKSNNRATIVIEHLIQASDIAHTMQHWYLYRKWNERLFHEMYEAYIAGRAEKDPSEFWYKGELGFFDHYVIPLAKKLRDCGVTGSIGEEYLRYAERNRFEWEQKGELIVHEMIESRYEGGGELAI